MNMQSTSNPLMDMAEAFYAAELIGQINSGDIAGVKARLTMRVLHAYLTCVKSGKVEKLDSWSFLFGENYRKRLEDFMLSEGIDFESETGIERFVTQARCDAAARQALNK